jgi:hypothetical protein
MLPRQGVTAVIQSRLQAVVIADFLTNRGV